MVLTADLDGESLEVINIDVLEFYIAEEKGMRQRNNVVTEASDIPLNREKVMAVSRRRRSGSLGFMRGWYSPKWERDTRYQADFLLLKRRGKRQVASSETEKLESELVILAYL
ncbi:hypothetical protein PAAG_11052 [Paracoccidioides lutzii Pb01]|uniref:Uncharacterized protein n=1 Tax=Paracoccidioides lutzii (strain ATCC MYA-826 / Pb01) TaxID=502779 RepID=A0A0A2V3Q2_PARBA|nr:hypothetical protein PAAG_11052 [Paracoccidioides lutzii Pb01]KGQ02103.1 hypothetical protein PAAG_11052 [Paracoccidioides lutzii Pb01]